MADEVGNFTSRFSHFSLLSTSNGFWNSLGSHYRRLDLRRQNCFIPTRDCSCTMNFLVHHLWLLGMIAIAEAMLSRGAFQMIAYIRHTEIPTERSFSLNAWHISEMHVKIMQHSRQLRAPFGTRYGPWQERAWGTEPTNLNRLARIPNTVESCDRSKQSWWNWHDREEYQSHLPIFYLRDHRHNWNYSKSVPLPTYSSRLLQNPPLQIATKVGWFSRGSS